MLGDGTVFPFQCTRCACLADRRGPAAGPWLAWHLRSGIGKGKFSDVSVRSTKLRESELDHLYPIFLFFSAIETDCETRRLLLRVSEWARRKLRFLVFQVSDEDEHVAVSQCNECGKVRAASVNRDDFVRKETEEKSATAIAADKSSHFVDEVVMNNRC